MTADLAVSVIMPLYNGRDHVGRAVESVLEQTHGNLELIVVDDGSTDGGAEVVRSFRDERIRLISQPNMGEGAARNAGLAAARGDFIAWQDADDISLPQRLSTMLAAVSESAAGFAHCDMILVDATERPLGLWQSANVAAARLLPFLLRVGTPYNNPTMLLRADAVRDCCFDTTLRIGTDTDFVAQFGPRTTGVHVPDVLVLYRRHSTNATANVQQGDVEPHVLRILGRYPLRRFVPEAWIGRDGTRAETLARALTGLHLARRGLTGVAGRYLRSACEALKGRQPEPVVAAVANLAGGNLGAASLALESCADNDPVAVNYRGEVQALQGRQELAFECFRESLRMAPSYEEPAVNLVAVGGGKGLNLVTPYWRRFAGAG